jgi:hypothetical protein
MESGFMFPLWMHIDTVVIEPEERTVTLVWRAILGKSEPIRKTEAQIFGPSEEAFIEMVSKATREIISDNPQIFEQV